MSASSGYNPTSPLDLDCECGCELTRRQCREVRHAIGAPPARVRATEAAQAPEAGEAIVLPDIDERLPTGLLGPLIDTLPRMGRLEVELVAWYCSRLLAGGERDSA